MKNISALFILFFCFTGCSWQEYFVLVNNSNSPIVISYQLEKPESGFAIFDGLIAVYKTNKSLEPDWDKKITVVDKEEAWDSVRFFLPPKCIVLLGELNNDNYTKHNQYFINGRTFNLKAMQIKTEKTVLEIKANIFDNYFKKQNGFIKYVLK